MIKAVLLEWDLQSHLIRSAYSACINWKGILRAPLHWTDLDYSNFGLAETINATLPTNFNGVYVDQIKKNSPADKAEIHGSIIDQYSIKHGGDIITAVDGYIVTRSEDLISYIDSHRSVGDNVIFKVHRNGYINLKTTLAAQPSPYLYPSPLPTQSPP